MFFYLSIDTESPPDNSQQVTKICDPSCVDFISNRHDLKCFELLGSAEMQMYGSETIHSTEGLICYSVSCSPNYSPSALTV